MLKRTIYCFIWRKSDVLLCHYWELFFFALEIQEELLRSVGGREIGFVILDFMDVVIARGWATDHAVEPQLLEGWRGDVTTRRRERSRLQRKTSLVTSALEGIFELENMEIGS